MGKLKDVKMALDNCWLRSMQVDFTKHLEYHIVDLKEYLTNNRYPTNVENDK